MTTFTELFSEADLLKRLWFRSTTINAATVSNLVIPSGGKVGIISAVGAGGWRTNDSAPGGGAAFARTKLNNLTAGESFSIQVGSTKFSLDAGGSQGDSIIVRVAGSSVICKAARGTGVLSGSVGIGGQVADCVGDVKRAGSNGNSALSQGGTSGGDLSDVYSQGFGGRGARYGRHAAAGPGGGGIHRIQYDPFSFKSFPPGAGLVCFEIWTKDPGYV